MEGRNTRQIGIVGDSCAAGQIQVGAIDYAHHRAAAVRSMARSGELAFRLFEVANLGETIEHSSGDDLAAETPFAGEIGLLRASAARRAEDEQRRRDENSDT